MPKAKGLRGKKDDDERPAPETEARAIDIKVKAAEDGETTQTAGNLDILKQMQEEKWTKYGWIDAEVRSIEIFFYECSPLTAFDCRRRNRGTHMRALCFMTKALGLKPWKLALIRKSTWIK